MSAPEYDIRPYRSGDEVGILASFNRVFREVCGPGYVDRDLGYWRWEYLGNPAGHRITVGMCGDLVAGNYSGTPQRFRTEFGPRTFVHAVDSFVVAEHRAGLKRPGLFISIAEPWFDDVQQRGDAMVYGYPVKQAERVGSRYLGYRRVRTIEYLARAAGEGSTAIAGDLELQRVCVLGEEVDALFERFALGKRCVLIRDRAYLQWRWLDIPHGARDFEVWQVRRRGELAGLMVLRPRHELMPGACTIADWCVPIDDRDAAQALLARATLTAREQGRGEVMAVFAEPSPEHAMLRENGFRSESSAKWHERILMHRTFDATLAEDWLIENWWYTIGDSDLV
ncbi:MAG: hypothetical protein U1F36_05635 [Planctomycetota bacterium]